MSEQPKLTAEDLDRYRRLIGRFLHRHWRDTHGIEDLVQETLLRAYTRLPGLRDPQRVEGWLLRIAHNLAMDWHRKKGRRECQTREPEPDTESLVPPADYTSEADHQRRRWSRSVRGALTELSGRDRAFVIGHYFVGLSCRQISQRSGLSLANVKVRLHRARQTLRRHLPEEDEFRRWLAHRALYGEGVAGAHRPLGRRSFRSRAG